MKNKRVLSVIVSFIMLVLVCSSPFISYASYFVTEGDLKSCPGNTRVYTPADKYNYSWIDSIIVRDGSLSVTPLTVYPVSDYPYSVTAKEFVEECNSYMKLFEASDSTVQTTLIDSLKTIYYTLVATDVITDSTQDMRNYNESCGIVYPYNESKFTDLYTALTYVCLHENLYKLVTDEDISITRGTTIEGAVVRLLSAVCDMTVSSDIDTIPAFSYLFTEKYVIEDGKYPVSENPTEEEVYYWVKLQAAQKAGYSVPASTEYDKLTSDQIEYVTYAYYASILTTKYDAPVNPILLKAALRGSNPSTEVPRLVLKSMLDNVSISYKENETVDSLFAKAAKEGYFDLENEFYTDIYSYKLFVPADCEKVWITAFPLADQLENGSNSNVQTYLNNKLVRNNTTNALDIGADGSTFTLKTTYTDKKDTSTYTFTVIRTADSGEFNDAPPISLDDSLSGISSSISNVITGATSNNDNTVTSPTAGYTFENQLTTYGADEIGSSDSSTYSFFETYPVDENGNVVTTTNPLELNPEEEKAPTALSLVADAVKENPGVVAAPAGLLTVSATAGFLFYRKRKEELDNVNNTDNQ